MMKKILSIMLILSMLLSVVVLTSCGGDKNGKDSQSTEETKTDNPEDTYNPAATADTFDPSGVDPDIRFDGHEFKFLNTSEVYYMYIYLDPDASGDVLDDSCAERNVTVEDKFGITLTEITYPFSELASHARTMINAGENIYDAMYLPSTQLTPMISENMFCDLMEIDSLGIDNIWWDQPLIERNIIEGRLFYATSDLHLMAFESVWAMYFNEGMMTELGLEAPYEQALNGTWTLEELRKYCAEVANLNGDQTFIFDPNGGATYGLSSPGTASYMAYAMGVEYTKKDENGRYQFIADTDTSFTSTWDTLIDFYGPDNGIAYNGTNADLDPDGYYGAFMAGRSLFLHAELKGATMLREWDGNFGLLPQPKASASQETYNSNIMSGCLSFCIPNTNDNLERTGTIVNYLTYLSYTDLMPKYYDIHVSLKALTKQESKDVLAIIRGTRGCEVAVPFMWASDLNAALAKLSKENNHNVTSTLETYRDQIIASINATYEEYPSLNHAK